MDVLMMLLVLAVWSLTLLAMIWLNLADWDGFLAWLAGIIMPKKKVKEFEQVKEIRRNKAFKKRIKQHNVKWFIRLLIVIPVYAAVYLFLAFLTRKLMLAFFIAVWPPIIVLVCLVTKENAERKNITKFYTKKPEGKCADSSTPCGRSK